MKSDKKVLEYLKNNPDVYIGLFNELHNCYEVTLRPGFHFRVSSTTGDLNDKKWLPNLWFKKGWIPKPIDSYLNIDTEVWIEDGVLRVCNPMVNDDGTINFEMIIPDNPDNVLYTIDKTIEKYKEYIKESR